MQTRITKWAAPAAFVVIMAVVVAVLNKAPSAFGLERVIEAYNNVRFLHVKTFGAGQQEPNEFWIQSDKLGSVARARYSLPVTEDGAKVITWTPERTELWFKSKRGYVTFQTTRIQGWMQSLLEQSQPQLVMKKLLDRQKAGQVDLQFQEPQGEQTALLIVALHKDGPNKEFYRIDPKTDLITRIEYYRVDGGNARLRSTTEFTDYNVPIDDKRFSLRSELPKDVRIADRLNQVCGVAQGNMTDEQAATETVRQFFQALVDKDYQKAGLILGGELEDYTRAEYGKLSAIRILSIGPPIPQPKWDKHGFQVPCELEILNANGQKVVWKPGAYVRPGDDETRPDRWNITGGVNPEQAATPVLPDNEKYAKMTPKEMAVAFFSACAAKNWEEVLKFWPMPGNDERFGRMKDNLGGLEVISVGEPFKSERYPGWYVPYEIKLPPQVVYVRVSNTNAAKRYVVNGTYDGKMRLQEELKWSSEPEVLANTDAAAGLSPAGAVKAYFNALLKLDWVEMRKFAPESDVEKTKREVEIVQKRGMDIQKVIPAMEVGEAVWSPELGSYLVQCRTSGQVRKWNLAVRNDNAANRYLFDGGL